MEIRPLDKETYAGRKFTARYTTSGYYDITASESGFAMQYTPFEFRISNICIFEKAARSRGIGTALMAAIQHAASASGARMIVLETQTCNETAIAFYIKRTDFRSSAWISIPTPTPIRSGTKCVSKWEKS